MVFLEACLHLADLNALPIVCDWFASKGRPSNFKIYPHPMTECLTWLEWLEIVIAKQWKTWGLYDMIIHSIVDIKLDMKHFFGFLNYWPISTNSLVFPCGMITHTLLDVAAILALQVIGSETSITYDASIPDFRFSY